MAVRSVVEVEPGAPTVGVIVDWNVTVLVFAGATAWSIWLGVRVLWRITFEELGTVKPNDGVIVRVSSPEPGLVCPTSATTSLIVESVVLGVMVACTLEMV